MRKNVLGALSTLQTPSGPAAYYRLDLLGVPGFDSLPFIVKIFLENVARLADQGLANEADLQALMAWNAVPRSGREFAFLPARVVLQDFTGVPVMVDLAAMRSAAVRMGGDPQRINPLVPADLVIDHSVQVDVFGSAQAFKANVGFEYQRNGERYALLRWSQQAFENCRVVPPGTGIVHQVNLEYLASVVQTGKDEQGPLCYPDTLVGTDSHTTMVNGLGVLGWGVGGIEAEAVLLGQPMGLLAPEVVGVRMTGTLPEGATATDLVLTVTEILRTKGVVDKFIEFSGPGLSRLSLADRATISNMSPEYGATAALFPVDAETLNYLRMTGREPALIDLVERYCKEQGLFRTDQTPEPRFGDLVELDLASVEPSLAGPRRPQDRVPLSRVRESFWSFQQVVSGGSPANAKNASQAAHKMVAEGGDASETMSREGARAGVAPRDGGEGSPLAESPTAGLADGSVVIAAITSCTNTSNPTVMMGAGLLAKKAVERGLRPKPYVKTSLAPGSQVVTDYLRSAGLLPYLEQLGFHLVGYGCTTCIGNSGPLPPLVAEKVDRDQLVTVAVLSGNRNFEGRIHPQVRASYLASPPLVVAYGLAGTVDIDLSTEPLGYDRQGQPVYLREIWPSSREIIGEIERSVDREKFVESYGRVFEGDEQWRALPVPPGGGLYAWDANSTYVREPPYFQDFDLQPTPLGDITGSRVLAVLGDSVTTDHISPAGSIQRDGPAGQYLIGRGVQPAEFNSYGARRGNHEVMLRGTFGNIRLRNRLVPEKEGDWTVHFPSGEVTRIYDASMRYRAERTPLLLLAGKEYGSGSSRDWAAKGTVLLGVKAVIAESYERIHRSNLVGMGVLPLQFQPGESVEALGLSGRETFDILGIGAGVEPGETINVCASQEDGSLLEFKVLARIDTPMEVEYYRHGGILPLVLRSLLKAGEKGSQTS